MSSLLRQRPTVGQVLTTHSGQKFRVEQVQSTYEPDDPLSTPDEFMVALMPLDGAQAATDDWDTEDFFGAEFEEWCSRHGVRY